VSKETDVIIIAVVPNWIASISIAGAVTTASVVTVILFSADGSLSQVNAGQLPSRGKFYD